MRDIEFKFTLLSLSLSLALCTAFSFTTHAYAYYLCKCTRLQSKTAIDCVHLMFTSDFQHPSGLFTLDEPHLQLVIHPNIWLLSPAVCLLFISQVYSGKRAPTSVHCSLADEQIYMSHWSLGICLPVSRCLSSVIRSLFKLNHCKLHSRLLSLALSMKLKWLSNWLSCSCCRRERESLRLFVSSFFLSWTSCKMCHWQRLLVTASTWAKANISLTHCNFCKCVCFSLFVLERWWNQILARPAKQVPVNLVISPVARFVAFLMLSLSLSLFLAANISSGVMSTWSWEEAANISPSFELHFLLFSLSLTLCSTDWIKQEKRFESSTVRIAYFQLLLYTH